jgi:hypothetical protein
MKKKVKWPVQKLLARGHQRLLRVWMRYVQNLRGEEEMVHICEPKTGRHLNDDEEKRSKKSLKNCQVSSEELSGCQKGNEKRSMIDLKDYQVGSEESSDFQVGNEMGSSEDLIDCQEDRAEISYFQVGK